MMQEMLARLFEAVLLCGAGMGLVLIVAAGVYDLKAAARRRRIGAAMQKLRRKSAQPLVTVIVYAHNDAETVTACLESLRRSQYENYDLVVVDNASQDGTPKAIRRFMKKHPRFALRFYAKRKRSPLQEALRLAYKKSRQGELIITLAASTRPPRSFLTGAVARFLADPDLAGLSVNERTEAPLTITSLVPGVASAVRHVFMKGQSLLRVRRAQAGLNGVYRSALISSGLKAQVRYEGALLLPVVQHAWRAGATGRRQLIWTVLAALTLILMSYAMVTAASLMSYVPLLLGWTLVAVGSVAAVWSDESIRMMQKLQLTFSATLIYFLLYVALLTFLLEQMTKSLFVFPQAVSLRRGLHSRRRAIS